MWRGTRSMLRCPRARSVPGNRKRLFNRLNQLDIGLFGRAERNVPSVRLVPGKLREIVAERLIFEVTNSAGKNFVASNEEPVVRKPLKLFARQILTTGIRQGEVFSHVLPGWDRPADGAGRGAKRLDRLHQGYIGLLNRVK